jgi:hypothetical protein
MKLEIGLPQEDKKLETYSETPVIYNFGNKNVAGRDRNMIRPSGRVVQRVVDQGESRGLKVGDLAIIYA